MCGSRDRLWLSASDNVLGEPRRGFLTTTPRAGTRCLVVEVTRLSVETARKRNPGEEFRRIPLLWLARNPRLGAGDDACSSEIMERLRFTHPAMATEFAVELCHDDPLYARQAAGALFDYVDSLDEQLSDFEEGSDIWRFNHSRAGQWLTVAPETCDCLALARQVQRITHNAFDVAYRSPRHASCGELIRFELDIRRCRVRRKDEHVVLDLGGIGKGFALDCCARLLEDWQINDALLWASTSTVLAKGRPPGERTWNVTIGPQGHVRTVELNSEALSASGARIQGPHIWDPRRSRPVDEPRRCWVRAPGAALADALSTAAVVMSERELKQLCRGRENLTIDRWCGKDERWEHFASPSAPRAPRKTKP